MARRLFFPRPGQSPHMFGKRTAGKSNGGSAGPTRTDADFDQCRFASQGLGLFQTWRGVREGTNGLVPEAIAEVTGVRLQPLSGNVNFNGSHRCLLVGHVGQGRVGGPTPARSVMCFASFASSGRPYPNSVGPCRFWPSPRHLLTRDERTFHLRPALAALEPFSRASNDEECQFRCPRVWLLGR